MTMGKYACGDTQNMPFLLTIRGVHTDADGHETSLETVYPCSFLKKAGKFFISYDEKQDGSFVRSVLIASEKELVIKKTGSVNTCMRFVPDAVLHTEYSAGPGTIGMDIRTNSLSVSDDGRDIKTDYSLFSGGEKLQDCRMHMQITND